MSEADFIGYCGGLGVVWLLVICVGEVIRSSMNWLDDYEKIRRTNPVIAKVMMLFGYKQDGHKYFKQKGSVTVYDDGISAVLWPLIALYVSMFIIYLCVKQPWVPLGAVIFSSLMWGGRAVRRIHKKHLRNNEGPR